MQRRFSSNVWNVIFRVAGPSTMLGNLIGSARHRGPVTSNIGGGRFIPKLGSDLLETWPMWSTLKIPNLYRAARARDIYHQPLL